MNSFVFGPASEKELIGVHSGLVRVVRRALTLTACDFAVHDGIRTLEEQKRLFAQGFSKTLRSKHLEGKAVDLVPFVEGKLRWWWPQIYQVAAAMRLAAEMENVRVWWGCVWDRPLNELATSVTDLTLLADRMKQEGLDYNARHVGPDFPDGPHFEVERAVK